MPDDLARGSNAVVVADLDDIVAAAALDLVAAVPANVDLVVAASAADGVVARPPGQLRDPSALGSRAERDTEPRLEIVPVVAVPDGVAAP